MALHVGGSDARHSVVREKDHGATAAFDIAAMLPGAAVSAVRITRRRSRRARSRTSSRPTTPRNGRPWTSSSPPSEGLRDHLAVERVGLVGKVERWTFTRAVQRGVAHRRADRGRQRGPAWAGDRRGWVLEPLPAPDRHRPLAPVLSP